MNRTQLLIKLALFVGYLLFAGFSVYFTATSLSLNILHGTYFWLIYILVLIIALLASWCLTNVLVESQKTRGASKTKFICNIIGFLVFWSISFATNVHYFFVEKHGYSVLTKELASAKKYITENTYTSNKKIDEKKHIAQTTISAQIKSNINAFNRELENTMKHYMGFGPACITILKSTENILRSDSRVYDDKNEYVIFDEVRDAGDKGVTQYNRLDGLSRKYSIRMLNQLDNKLSVMDKYYENQKKQNTELTELLDTIAELETVHLPLVERDGSADAFYKYCGIQNKRVIAQMPNDYQKKCIKGTKDNIISFNVYPSERMFDTVSVWGDIVKGRLIGMTIIQWIIISLIIDIAAFILFALFRKY